MYNLLNYVSGMVKSQLSLFSHCVSPLKGTVPDTLETQDESGLFAFLAQSGDTDGYTELTALLSAERKAGKKESAAELAKAKEEVLVLRDVGSMVVNADDKSFERELAVERLKRAIFNTSESATKYAEEFRKEGREEVWKQIDAMPTVMYMDEHGNSTRFKEHKYPFDLIIRPTKQEGGVV